MPINIKRLFVIFLLFIIPAAARAQAISELFSGNKVSLRGLSVVDNSTVWVSGNKGTVGKSIDGGKTWNWIKVKGYDSTDFRDIEAFDANTAVIMGVASPAYILKTTDGGGTWKTVYENKQKDMFLDAMDFFDDRNGVVVGDPVNGKLFIARTTDGGNSWKEIPEKDRPEAIKDEAFFASSGTNVRMTGKNEFIFLTGGKQSRLFIHGKPAAVPFIQGKETAGGNSVSKYKDVIIAVGGDFNDKNSDDKVSFTSTDAGKTWTETKDDVSGYLSCVEHLQGTEWIACGLNGVEYSTDNGMQWKHLADTDYYVCRKAKKGEAVYLAGGNGRIGKMN